MRDPESASVRSLVGQGGLDAGCEFIDVTVTVVDAEADAQAVAAVIGDYLLCQKALVEVGGAVGFEGQEMAARDAGRRQQRRTCLLYTSPSPRDVEESRMPSSA